MCISGILQAAVTVMMTKMMALPEGSWRHSRRESQPGFMDHGFHPPSYMRSRDYASSFVFNLTPEVIRIPKAKLTGSQLFTEHFPV